MGSNGQRQESWRRRVSRRRRQRCSRSPLPFGIAVYMHETRSVSHPWRVVQVERRNVDERTARRRIEKETSSRTRREADWAGKRRHYRHTGGGERVHLRWAGYRSNYAFTLYQPSLCVYVPRLNVVAQPWRQPNNYTESLYLFPASVLHYNVEERSHSRFLQVEYYDWWELNDRVKTGSTTNRTTRWNCLKTVLT